MGKINLKTKIEEFAIDCTNYKLNGLCILSQKEKDKSALAAVVCGNPVDIVMAIIKSMNEEPLMAKIIEAAVEYQKHLNELADSDIDELLKDYHKN